MKFHHIVKPFLIMLFVLGLAVGCASTPDEPAAVDQATAEQAIADAKAANAQAKEMGAEWRDTGKIIEEAETALAAGDYAKATELANKARRQAENAMAQARAEADRLKAEAAASSAVMTSGGMAGSYTVVSGDSLWTISAKDDVYANPYQWPLIYKANRDKINDADLIFAGQMLDIDQGASSTDVDAAIQHAKTRGAWSIGVVEESDKAYLAQ